MRWSLALLCALMLFPSPRGVELHKPALFDGPAGGGVSEFPSPRGVELHKPTMSVVWLAINLYQSFRPLAGLSCINPAP